MKVKITKDQSDQVKLELFSENEEDISDLKKLIYIDKFYKERHSFEQNIKSSNSGYVEFSGLENYNIPY